MDTASQVRFERAGGFFKGFDRIVVASTQWKNNAVVTNPGTLGVGANMCFARSALSHIGEFDEALDTGPPLPGGGDNDIFFRICAFGLPIIYEPRLIVAHDHRRDMAALRDQYYSWGLCTAAFLQKHLAHNREMRPHIRRMILRYIMQRCLRPLPKAMINRDVQRLDHVVAEFAGFMKGCFGEYHRSKMRIATRVQARAGLDATVRLDDVSPTYRLSSMAADQKFLK